MKRPVVLLLGPHRAAVSGVSTHLNLLFASRLAQDFDLAHFQVGSEGRAGGPLARAWSLLASPFALAAAILARRADLVHINTSLNMRAFWRDLAYLVVTRLCGARALYQVHGGALPQQFFPSGRAAEAIARMTLRMADAIVVLAEVELDAYRRYFPGQPVVLCPNGIEVVQYANCARMAGGAAADLKLVYVGRLAAEKGLFEVLEGLSLARRRGVRARIALAGSGPDEARLRRYAEQSGLAADTAFVGPVHGDDKIRLLAASDVLVLASHAEGLPYALLEGMAAGNAVITTRVGAIPDVVSEGVHGLFVPPRDPQAIAGAIAALARDRAVLERMRNACRLRIAGGYSLERLAGRFKNLYAEICAARQMKAADAAMKR
jgi:glycosyltransferase involved in cell wall biosynthesis